jgi:adenosylmethionine-8-amino-7-oxononanoate aminotransferase
MERDPANTAVFHRSPRHHYPIAVAGEGPYLIDASGKRYLDGSGGAAVSCLGHSDRAVLEAIKGQLDRLPFAHTSFFTNEPLEALAADLVGHAPEGIAKAYLVSGGSEAMEAALKLARQYFLEAGEPQRTRVIARRQSYHGNTLGALATGGNRFRRRPFEPLLAAVTHVAPCYPYRDQQPGETADAYGERLAAELDGEIRRLGAGTVIAFVAETVVGATLGAQPAVPGYFKRVREVCDRHGCLLILDEVMCGMGRCGTLYASEAEGVVPDLIAIGKGLGAGYQPLGALLVQGRIFDAVVQGSGYFQHGHTYSGHAAACAAGLAVQRAIRERGLLEQVRLRGARLRELLKERFGDLELVADRSSKAPFDPAMRVHARIKLQALENGLLCYPMGGTIDGAVGDHVLLAPPYIVAESHLVELVDKLGATIDQVLGRPPP